LHLVNIAAISAMVSLYHMWICSWAVPTSSRGSRGEGRGCIHSNGSN